MDAETIESAIDIDPYMVQERQRQFELIDILRTADLEKFPLHHIEMLSRQKDIIDISILNK